MNPNSPNSPEQPSSATGGVLPRETEQRLKSDADAVVQTAKESFNEIKSAAESEVSELAAQGKEQVEKVIEKAKGLATEQKDLLSEQLTGVAAAVSKVAGELESEQSATAGYARTLADTVDRFTTTIKDKDVDELLHMAEDFGRRQPGAMMAVAALAGFAASRFLVASAKRREPGYSTQAGAYGGTGYGRSGYDSSGYGRAASNYGTSGGSSYGRSYPASSYSGTRAGDDGQSVNYTGTARGSEALAAEAESNDTSSGQSGGSQSTRRAGQGTGRGGAL